MRKGALLLTTALAFSVAGVGTASTERRVPVVRITGLAPLVVVGERFRRAERLTITVRVEGDRLVRRQRASRRGTFVVRFAQTTVDRCGGGVAVVVTRAGGRVVAKVRIPPRECPPAP